MKWANTQWTALDKLDSKALAFLNKSSSSQSVLVGKKAIAMIEKDQARIKAMKEEIWSVKQLNQNSKDEIFLSKKFKDMQARVNSAVSGLQAAESAISQGSKLL